MSVLSFELLGVQLAAQEEALEGQALQKFFSVGFMQKYQRKKHISSICVRPIVMNSHGHIQRHLAP